MLKNFFLSEKKLLNTILRANLKYMNNGPAVDSWNSVTANQIEAFQQLTKERKCCHCQSDFFIHLLGSWVRIPLTADMKPLFHTALCFL